MNQAVSELVALRGSIAYQGWTMVLVGFVSIACVFATSTAAIPLIYGPVLDEFGWSRTQTTLMFTYKNAASALVALFLVGPLCKRFGLRSVTICAFVLTGLAMISFLWIHSLWSYYAAGVLLGFGVTTTFVATKVLVSRWFAANQGLALGIVLAGASFGGFIVPIVYDHLYEAYGWRAAFALLSVFIWAIALPLYLAKAKDRPDIDDAWLQRKSVGRTSTAVTQEDERVADLMTKPSFWWIVLSLFLIANADAGLMQHTALFLERDAGLSSSATASTLSAILGLGIVAKAGAGWIYDRYSLRGVRFWYFLLALSIVLTQTVVGPLTLVLFAAVRGVAHSGLMSEPALVAKHCYGPRLLNVAVPIFMGVWLSGAALGPIVLSLSYDIGGSYRGGFIALLAFSAVALFAMKQVRPRFWEERVANRTRDDGLL